MSEENPADQIIVKLTRGQTGNWQAQTSLSLPTSTAFEVGEALAMLLRHCQTNADRLRIAIATSHPQELAEFDKGLEFGRAAPQVTDRCKSIIREPEAE